MTTTKTPFLLNPLYSRYELGIAQLDNDVLKYWLTPDVPPQKYQPWAVVFAVVCTGIVMAVSFDARSHTTRADPAFDLIVIGVIVFLVLIFAAGLLNELRPKVRRTRAAYRRLRQTRTVVDGELISLQQRGWDYSYYSKFEKVDVTDYVVTARYTFVSPTTGETLSGVVQRKRPDLRRIPLPPSGTPVRVLYADDDAHMML